MKANLHVDEHSQSPNGITDSQLYAILELLGKNFLFNIPYFWLNIVLAFSKVSHLKATRKCLEFRQIGTEDRP